jgi:polysaccharide deacetylase family protein (PEP-CTERM system associated)
LKNKFINNFLTLDVEEWFDAEIPRRKLTSNPDENTRIEEQIDLFLDICNYLNIKSTCFVIGKLAEKKPHIVKKLHESGHEVASHSYAHKLVYSMSPGEFKEDLHKSVSILEDLTGEKVKGYRAPSWSVNSQIAEWFYPKLEEENILYSSSVYPAKTFLYGMPEAINSIHKAGNTNIIEIPQPLLNLGLMKTGISGGTYLRMAPAWFVRKFIRSKNIKGNSVFIYLHPWELIYKKYPVKLSIIDSIIQYRGIRNNPKKIENICHSFQQSFVRMDKYIDIFSSKYLSV